MMPQYEPLEENAELPFRVDIKYPGWGGGWLADSRFAEICPAEERAELLHEKASDDGQAGYAYRVVRKNVVLWYECVT